MPEQPDPTAHLQAMFEDARAYCLFRYNYSPPEVYVSPEAREQHIDNDARAETLEPHFAMPWNAGYARGLAAGQAERDQLRRLHEATEAALEQAEQHARDTQDELLPEVADEAHQRGIAEGRRAAVAAILALTEPRDDTFRSEAVLTAYAVAAEIANGGPLSPEENALLDLRADNTREQGRRQATEGVSADLALVLNQRVMHSHQRSGVWDDDNRADLAGQPCVECAARARLGRLVGPWETAEQPEPTPAAEATPSMHWQCTRCDLDLDGNPRFCWGCGYTVYRPIHHEPATGGVVDSAPVPLTRDGQPLLDFNAGIGEGGPLKRAERKPTRWRRDDFCGPEHTYRDSCVYAEQARDA